MLSSCYLLWCTLCRNGTIIYFKVFWLIVNLPFQREDYILSCLIFSLTYHSVRFKVLSFTSCMYVISSLPLHSRLFYQPCLLICSTLIKTLGGTLHDSAIYPHVYKHSIVRPILKVNYERLSNVCFVIRLVTHQGKNVALSSGTLYV